MTPHAPPPPWQPAPGDQVWTSYQVVTSYRDRPLAVAGTFVKTVAHQTRFGPDEVRWLVSLPGYPDSSGKRPRDELRLQPEVVFPTRHEAQVAVHVERVVEARREIRAAEGALHNARTAVVTEGAALAALEASPLVYTHVLKTIEPYFSQVARGEKTFEVRKDDRPEGFEAGDYVQLVREPPDPEAAVASASLAFRISSVLRGPAFGIADGYCVLSLSSDPPRGETTVIPYASPSPVPSPAAATEEKPPHE